MQYTVLKIETINKLTQQYNIQEIVSFEILSGGSENTNYLINSNSNSYVLTICEQKTIIEANNLASLLEYLAGNHFATSKIIRNKKNELISEYNNKPVILKSFLEGKIIEDLPIQLIELIGIQMGRLHRIKAPDYIPQKLNYGVENFQDVAIYAKDSSFHNWLIEIEAQIKPYLSQAIPKALIHSDIFYSNVIIDNEESSITIMDFEEATYYYRIFDIGMTIVGVCREGEIVNLEKVTNLLKGYVQEIELSDLEKEALQSFTVYAAASMSFWRHRNFNFTNPTPGMEKHFLALKKIADFVNKLPKGCFKQLLNS